MSDTDRNNLIAAKFRELADLFHGVAQGAGPATDEPKKKTKKETPPPPADEPATETDTVITPDHPKRAELQKAAKEYANLTSMADAQKAMKLFGESSKVVPDSELAGAIVHFKNLVKKSAKPADDETI